MMIENILYIIFTVLLAYYIYFLLSIFRGLGNLPASQGQNLPAGFISIIVPFRNERDNLQGNLTGLQAQDYPTDKFEIIYVNDSSDDDSVEVLKKSITSNNISVISVPDEYSPNAHKKRAVRYGIENAKGEIIVTTDADCFHGKNWLRTMAGYLDEKTAFVSGPVEFTDGENIFGVMQKNEFAGLVIAGAGLIGSGRPTICNAANILYRKEVYESVRGFNDNMNLSSGDDELLMQKIHRETDYKIKFCPEPDAVVKTAANESLEKFYQQRKRWASKGLFYGDSMLVFKLILIFLFYLGLVAQIFLGMFYSSQFLLFFLSSFALKIISEYLVLGRGTRLLFKRKILKHFLLTEIFHIPYIVLSGFAGALGNFTWKERKVNR